MVMGLDMISLILHILGKDCRNLIVMKKLGLLISIFLLGGALSASAQSINLNLNNVTVKEAISMISQETGYTIVVNSDVVNLDKKVSVKATNGTIKTVIDQLFAG